MAKDEDVTDLPLLNSEKFYQLLSLYKLPFLFLLIGLAFFALCLVMLSKNQSGEKGIVFTSESSPSANVKIRVDVEGAVMTPGVYSLSAESRILDALSAAGGLSQKADREYISKNLNKAAKLIDGSKIYIPAAGESSDSHISDLGNLSNLSGITTGTVNINTDSSSQLEALPGVGPVTAGKIISGRPYQNIEELKTKKIVGSALFDKIKDLITVY